MGVAGGPVAVVLLELLVLRHEGHSQGFHYLRFFPFQVEVAHGLLDCNPQVALLNYVLHLNMAGIGAPSHL